MATPDYVQVEVISRIPKYARRLGRARPPMLRLRVGAHGEVPPWMVERWPDALKVIVPTALGTDDQILEDAEVGSTEPVVEAAVTSDVAPTKSPQPIKPPRTPRKRRAATTPRRQRASKE